MTRRAAALAPDLRAATLRAFARLRARLSAAELETFIRSQQAERIFSEILTPQVIDQAFAPVSEILRNGVESASKAVARTLPGAAQGVSFNVLAPKIVDGIRELDTRVIGTLKEDIRETVRAYVEQGLREGVNPREVARNLRSVIGLAPNQAAAVQNFERMLREGDVEALTRTLRDRRFDGTLQKAFGQRGGVTAYHGAPAPFSRFDAARIGSGTDAGFLGRGFYFSTDPAVGRSSPVTLRVRLDVKNPLKISLPSWGADKQALVRGALDLPLSATAQEVTAALRAKGFDSVSLDYSSLGYKHREIMVPDADRIRIGGGLSEPQIQQMTTAYRNRMTAFHAETITRTAALDAQRLAQHLTWQDAVDRGDIDGSKLTKRWSGTLDDRERDSHLAMENETVPFDQPYSNGQMIPGDSEFNCRCVSIMETSGTVKPGAGDKGISVEQLRGVGSRLRGAA